jgi:opacity protein-like surface antigen
MAKLRALVLAGIGAVSCEWATAADLPPAPSLPSLSPAEAQFGGWYLRGDVGAGFNSAAPELRTEPDPIAAGVAGGFIPATATAGFSSASLSPLGMADIGGGYQLNGWLRADATLEYRTGARLQSRYVPAELASPIFSALPQDADISRADVSSFVGLLNAYMDLGTWYAFSPFVGAGVGFADNRVSSFADQGLGYGGGSKTSFAFAVMAGVDFDVTPNIKLELGYRYLNYGAITTGALNCPAGESVGVLAIDPCRGALTISSRNRLASNDLRLGLIYLIGEAPPPPVVTNE